MNKDLLKKIIYSSGDIFFPENIKRILSTDIIGTSKKTFYISGWSIVHVISGIIFGYLYLYFNYDIRFYTLKMLAFHTIWELWQVLTDVAKPYKLTGNGNLVDSIMDTIFFMMGAYIIWLYQIKKKI